ncbi:MAG: DUF805 domain-containing protein [Pelagimonas sp.]|uniref:DUF805 domain-containing protein n=1 Tax=Pelagimonas sp. TaxID=2073170 RepID=UPI003D6B77F6
MIPPHTALENYFFRAFDISGRATRAEFWWVTVILIVFGVIAFVMDAYTIFTAPVTNYNPMAYLTPFLLLVTFIPSTTLMIRRLHDAGRSGMWYFVNSIPIIGPIWLLVLLVLPSDTEHNQWGQPPQDPRAARTFDQFNGQGKAQVSDSKPHDARQSYATLLRLEDDPSPEEVAEQREQISDYYRTRVLGRNSTA